MLITAAPGALLWPAGMIVWGPGYVSSIHAHHCFQLVMTLRGTLTIRGHAEDKWLKCNAALVKPDVTHAVEAQATTVLIAFVDAQSELGSALSQRVRADITRIAAREVARWRAELGTALRLDPLRVEGWVRRSLLRGRQEAPMHPRVKRVIRYLRAELASQSALSLENLARIAGLSPSRLIHVFTTSVGVPPRPYVLWLRLQLACGQLVRGASATEAAHAAGFSDAAHMSRTFRRMLGTKPSELIRRETGGSAFLR